MQRINKGTVARRLGHGVDVLSAVDHQRRVVADLRSRRACHRHQERGCRGFPLQVSSAFMPASATPAGVATRRYPVMPLTGTLNVNPRKLHLSLSGASAPPARTVILLQSERNPTPRTVISAPGTPPLGGEAKDVR